MLAEDDLPTNTYYGDGDTISDEVVAHLRDSSHGREPFTGPRKIAVTMAEP